LREADRFGNNRWILSHQDALDRLAEHLRQLHIHLLQRLLHVLHLKARVLDQALALVTPADIGFNSQWAELSFWPNFTAGLETGPAARAR
jgi:hypothetical protein